MYDIETLTLETSGKEEKVFGGRKMLFGVWMSKVFEVERVFCASFVEVRQFNKN